MKYEIRKWFKDPLEYPPNADSVVIMHCDDKEVAEGIARYLNKALDDGCESNDKEKAIDYTVEKIND